MNETTDASRRMIWAAALVGSALGLLITLVPTLAGEPLTRMLRVGVESDALPFIASEFDTVLVTAGAGHDGQYNYLVARDPFGLEGPIELAGDPGYRLRRALLGWTAGLWGFASPSTVLLGFALLTAAGWGLATAALADLMLHFRAPRWVLVGSLGAMGMWLSVELATTDTLMMGFGLLGLALVARDRTVWAALAFSASVLAKETGLAFAAAAAGWLLIERRYREATITAMVPAGVLVAWAGWIEAVVGGGFSTKGNVDVPLRGLLTSAVSWESGSDLVLGLAALLTLAVGVAGLWSRHPLVRLAILPWLALAVVSSDLVWGDGNNAARVFAPLWALGVLGIGTLSGREAQTAEA